MSINDSSMGDQFQVCPHPGIVQQNIIVACTLVFVYYLTGQSDKGTFVLFLFNDHLFYFNKLFSLCFYNNY